MRTVQIGRYSFNGQLFLAPMAGVTDRAFRSLCRKLGAAYAVGEMVLAKTELYESKKTLSRINHLGEVAPIVVQILGTEPLEMANAARFNIERGAQIIDINMGCPAKKVCKKLAGSALMKDERLALAIIEAVVKACEPLQVPVTLKMRTGWCEQIKNAPQLARDAQNAGIAMLTIHGRTREQGYRGHAEYDTIAKIKQTAKVPVVANGDIDSPQKALSVLKYTGADALMIGRAAQKRPWIFNEINTFLATGQLPDPPSVSQVWEWISIFLSTHYQIHGEQIALRRSRKYISNLVSGLPHAQHIKENFNAAQNLYEQLEVLQNGLLKCGHFPNNLSPKI